MPDSDGSHLSCSPNGGGGEPPVLTLVGPATQSLECRTPYTDPGATATDACFGDLTGSIARTGTVNSDVPASYTLTYAVSNPAGQSATPVARTVNVIDTLPPAVIINGSPTAQVECGDAFNDPGATASDACRGDLTAAITRTGSVNSGVPGDYALQYTVSDGTHSASADRAVEVRDTQKPTLALNGPFNVAYECGSSWSDPGAAASDACAGDLTGAIVVTKKPVDGQPNSFTLTYSVADPSGNVAEAGPRRVTEYDTLPPVLALAGPSNLALECGAAFTDPGATASDACSGELTSRIVRTGSVNRNVPASYTLAYAVSDPAGNNATPVSRTVNVSDTLAPVLTVNGPSNLTVECGPTFNDPGAVATDQCAGALPVVVTGTVNPKVAGNYTLEYQATDFSGHGVSETRSVTVADTQPPVITLFGPLPLVLECGHPFNDPGAVATDLCKGDVTASMTRTGSVNPQVPVDYSLHYTVSDGTNSVSVDRQVQVRDTLKPTLSINGPLHQTFECGSTYVDPGATATDACAGDLTSVILATQQGIDGQPGSFTITYSVTDPSGNTATSSVPRTVTVNDEEPPTLALLGAATMALECGTPYVDPGAIAEDACFGDLTSEIVRTGEVNSGVPASYTLTYNVSDPAGNSAPPVARTVNVSDTLAPALALNGPQHLLLECSRSPFADPGAVAMDQCAGPLPVVTTGTVDLSVAGNYTLEYQATDPAGHEVSATRSVTVSDVQPPIVILMGSPHIQLECGIPYTDPGALAEDLCRGDLTAAITLSGSVNSKVPGDYLLQYSVSDGANSGSASRTVEVLDRMRPLVGINGPLYEAIECGSVYVDPGATAFDICAGDLTSAIVATQQPIDGQPNAFTISYSVTDPSGNFAIAAAQRTVTAYDTVPPVLALVGAANLEVQVGTPYVDPGARATDACSGDLTSQIVRLGSVNTSVPGSYTLTYTVVDPAGHGAKPVTRTVRVVDSQLPTLTVLGPLQASLECGDPFTDWGAVANDTSGEPLPVVVTGAVDSHVPGLYALTYQATGHSGQVASATRSVAVSDTLPPTISVGAITHYHECGTPFPAPSAFDQCAGPLPAEILGVLDPKTPGDYSIGYRAVDPAGNVALVSNSRVLVVDSEQPVLQLLPGPSIIECNGTPYVDPGATASDLCYGDLTNDIAVTSDLDQSRSGVYTIGYTVTDTAGNVRTASRSITVGPCTPSLSVARLSELSRLSAQLAGLTTNGTVKLEAAGGILLRGTAPALNIFDLDAGALTEATRLSIAAPAGSLGVVNIYGDSATFAGFEPEFLGGIDRDHILYNFVDATDIRAGRCEFEGTVLAPFGRIQLDMGSPGAMRCSKVEGVWLRP